MKSFSTMLIGAVQYTISSTEKDVIDARYVSMGSMEAKPGKICTGRAVGDTSSGFPGSYVIQYFDAGDQLAGTYDWSIEAIGDAFRLTWRARAGEDRLPSKPGDILYEGIGFASGDRSICVAYWFTEELTRKMERKYAARAAD